MMVETITEEEKLIFEGYLTLINLCQCTLVVIVGLNALWKCTHGHTDILERKGDVSDWK